MICHAFRCVPNAINTIEVWKSLPILHDHGNIIESLCIYKCNLVAHNDLIYNTLNI